MEPCTPTWWPHRYPNCPCGRPRTGSTRGPSRGGGSYVVGVPPWLYRIARWEVTDRAVYTLHGWLVREWRIAPISRVQTVDTQRGPLRYRISVKGSGDKTQVSVLTSAGNAEVGENGQRILGQLVNELR